AVLFLKSNVVAFLDTTAKSLASGPNALLIQTTCVSVAVSVFIIAILFLFLELHRPASKRLQIQVADAKVEVTMDAITQRLEAAISDLADVLKVKPHVKASGKSGAVDVFLELETSAQVNVPNKTQEVITAAKQVLEEKMGLKVGKIQVKLDHLKAKK
ncbi:MAG: hypothetical protein HY257_02485, partial [Chloroflexi bacterium]|nr:hypothetical protein [Chloroflexota bacterium]